MTLYVVRHGQREINLVRRFTGWSQANLTDQGIADGKRAGILQTALPKWFGCSV